MEYYKIIRINKFEKDPEIIKIIKGFEKAHTFAINFIHEYNSSKNFNKISTHTFEQISTRYCTKQEFNNKRGENRLYGGFYDEEHYISIESICLDDFIMEEENKIKALETELMKKIQDKKNKFYNVLSELNNLS